MRNIWMLAVVAVVAVAAGCDGELGAQTWDKNGDGLVAACEGLSRFFCGATPGCEGQQLACLAVCRDDGKGGCQNACPDDFQCVPTPLPRCQDLNPHQCSADKRCIQTPGVCPALCQDDGNGGCLPCNAVSSCQPRPPESQPACSLIPIGVCPLVPACHVETQTTCAGASDASSPGNARGGCWSGGCTTTQVCVNSNPPPSCEATPVDSCTANPSCEIQYGVCKVACSPGGVCPPCATSPHCGTKPNLTCESRSVTDCNSNPGCVIETVACLAVCEDDGNGGCKPCPSASRCVSLPQPTPPPLPPTK